MSEIRCPNCGSPMVLRTAKRGLNPGKQFYGCSKYPGCATTVPFEPPSNMPSVVPLDPVTAENTELRGNIIDYRLKISSDFEGTVIDIETIGEFDPQFRRTSNSREYKPLQQVIFGFINKEGLRILCAKDREAISELGMKTVAIIDTLKRPYYALNTHFESGVWFHQLDIIITFDGELQAHRAESKKAARQVLSIGNYDDPFNDDGKLCMQAWLDQQFYQTITHNRACLLKERDILIQRGHRMPDTLKFDRG